MRSASGSAVISCSGRLIRSQYRDTGLKQSLTDTSCDSGGLELLEHRRRAARREDVARQQQHRQAVDRGQRGAGQHVRRARPDRARAGERPPPVGHLGEAHRGVHHRLLVPREIARADDPSPAAAPGRGRRRCRGRRWRTRRRRTAAPRRRGWCTAASGIRRAPAPWSGVWWWHGRQLDGHDVAAVGAQVRSGRQPQSGTRWPSA